MKQNDVTSACTSFRRLSTTKVIKRLFVPTFAWIDWTDDGRMWKSTLEMGAVIVGQRSGGFRNMGLRAHGLSRAKRSSGLQQTFCCTYQSVWWLGRAQKTNISVLQRCRQGGEWYEYMQVLWPVVLNRFCVTVSVMAILVRFSPQAMTLHLATCNEQTKHSCSVIHSSAALGCQRSLQRVLIFPRPWNRVAESRAHVEAASGVIGLASLSSRPFPGTLTQDKGAVFSWFPRCNTDFLSVEEGYRGVVPKTKKVSYDKGISHWGHFTQLLVNTLFELKS